MTRLDRSLLLLALVALAPTALPVHGQFLVAPRVGTMGIVGVEVVGVATDRIEVRGGIGVWTLEAETEFDEIPMQVSFPDLSLNFGVDYYLNESFRVGGGLLLRNSYPTLRGTYDGVINVGGTPITATEAGTITGVVTSNKQAGYAVIGFGRPTGNGLGLSLDVGAAFLGDPSVSLMSEGGTFPEDEMAVLLAAEEQDFEDDMKTYFRIWPILSISLRIPFQRLID